MTLFTLKLLHQNVYSLPKMSIQSRISRDREWDWECEWECEFEWEWLSRPAIVDSNINYQYGSSAYKIFAHPCCGCLLIMTNEATTSWLTSDSDNVPSVSQASDYFSLDLLWADLIETVTWSMYIQYSSKLALQLAFTVCLVDEQTGYD